MPEKPRTESALFVNQIVALPEVQALLDLLRQVTDPAMRAALTHEAVWSLEPLQEELLEIREQALQQILSDGR